MATYLDGLEDGLELVQPDRVAHPGVEDPISDIGTERIGEVQTSNLTDTHTNTHTHTQIASDGIACLMTVSACLLTHLPRPTCDFLENVTRSGGSVRFHDS